MHGTDCSRRQVTEMPAAMKTHLKQLVHRDSLCLLLGISFGLNIVLLWSYVHRSTGNGSTKMLLKQKPKPFYVCPYFRGGLGNLMFQYASVYGIAKSTGRTFGIYTDNDLYDIFELIQPTLSDKSICGKAQRNFGSEKHCTYDTVNMAIPTDRNIMIMSYVQSWKYFANVENEIRKHFRFKEDIRRTAYALMKQAVSRYSYPEHNSVTVVGIHVRRGDYLTKEKVKFGYRVATRVYFKTTMDYFRSKYDNVLFMVFTNPVDPDMTWCKSNIRGSDVMYMFGNSRKVDMCMLSMCDHIITSAGTFGWWAAFLNNGTKTYFRDFVRSGSQYERSFNDNGADYLYPGWLGF